MDGPDGMGWDMGGMEGTTPEGAIMGATLLDLEGQRAEGSSGWHQLCRCCKGTD